MGNCACRQQTVHACRQPDTGAHASVQERLGMNGDVRGMELDHTVQGAGRARFICYSNLLATTAPCRWLAFCARNIAYSQRPSTAHTCRTQLAALVAALALRAGAAGPGRRSGARRSRSTRVGSPGRVGGPGLRERGSPSAAAGARPRRCGARGAGVGRRRGRRVHPLGRRRWAVAAPVACSGGQSVA